MNSSSQSGHIQNIANFSLLTTICAGLDSRYNPSNSSLKISSLQAKYEASSAANEEVKQHLVTHSLAVDDQEKDFLKLKKLVGRIESAVGVSGADKAILKDLKTITRKMNGTRATPKKKASAEQAAGATQETEPTYISVAQTGYPNKVENLGKIVIFLDKIPEYQPNEAELSISAIKAELRFKDFIQGLETKHTKKQTALVALQNSRMLRDNELYHDQTGLVAIAQYVKKYIKSVFGYNSPEYKQVSKIQFKKIKP